MNGSQNLLKSLSKNLLVYEPGFKARCSLLVKCVEILDRLNSATQANRFDNSKVVSKSKRIRKTSIYSDRIPSSAIFLAQLMVTECLYLLSNIL